MLCIGNNALIGVVFISMENRLLLVAIGYGFPQFPRTAFTSIPHIKSDDLARLGIHGKPNPLLVFLIPHEAQHLVGFHLRPLNNNVIISVFQAYV